jgi:hypothetical protein
MKNGDGVDQVVPINDQETIVSCGATFIARPLKEMLTEVTGPTEMRR